MPYKWILRFLIHHSLDRHAKLSLTNNLYHPASAFFKKLIALPYCLVMIKAKPIVLKSIAVLLIVDYSCV
jgi:hypothetical protein